MVVVQVRLLLLLAVLSSSVGGLVVAAILRRLDNIVKEYSAASANLLTALFSTALFPDKASGGYTAFQESQSASLI